MEERRADARDGPVDAAGLPPAPPARRPASVLVADDVEIVCDRIGAVIAADDRLDVLDKARDGVEALEMIRRYRPDVVVLDVFMPRLEADGVLEALGTRDRPKVLLLTADPTAELHDAIMAGPDALLYKSAIAEGRICEEIVALVEGREDSLGRRLLAAARWIAEERPDLTPSELTVLRCAAEDATAKEIAAKLGREVKQVQNQIQSIHRKLKVGTTTGAVAKAYETGLLRRPRGAPPLV